MYTQIFTYDVVSSAALSANMFDPCIFINWVKKFSHAVFKIDQLVIFVFCKNFVGLP